MPWGEVGKGEGWGGHLYVPRCCQCIGPGGVRNATPIGAFYIVGHFIFI